MSLNFGRLIMSSVSFVLFPRMAQRNLPLQEVHHNKGFNHEFKTKSIFILLKNFMFVNFRLGLEAHSKKKHVSNTQ